MVAVWAVPVLVAVILHEISHGAVAYALGDNTARDAGRLTLNPIPHIDPIGTIALPALLIFSGAPFLFGYAKPVPVNFRQLHWPKAGMVLVAAAGPLTNLVLAAISAYLLRMVGGEEGLVTRVLVASVIMNIVLGVFNMIPIPPLDGGRVMTGLLPMPVARLYARLEPFGMFIIVALLMTGSLDTLIGPVVDALLNVLL